MQHSDQNRRFLTANMRAKLSLQNASFTNYLFRAELTIDTFDITNVVSMGLLPGAIGQLPAFGVQLTALTRAPLNSW